MRPEKARNWYLPIKWELLQMGWIYHQVFPSIFVKNHFQIKLAGRDVGEWFCEQVFPSSLELLQSADSDYGRIKPSNSVCLHCNLLPTWWRLSRRPWLKALQPILECEWTAFCAWSITFYRYDTASVYLSEKCRNFFSLNIKGFFVMPS